MRRAMIAVGGHEQVTYQGLLPYCLEEQLSGKDHVKATLPERVLG